MPPRTRSPRRRRRDRRLPAARGWRSHVRLALRLSLAGVGATLLLVGALRVVRPPTSALVVERRIEAALDGRWLGVERRWVPLERIAEPMRLAVVAAEDQRFPSHGGFDLDAVADALDDASRGRRLRGASTLTQQVAKNLFLWPGRSVVRKAFEAYFTVLLEALWPKRRILEVYLNIVELGPGIFGVEAASQRYFGKPASRLGAAEAARLAAILPNPVKRSAVHPSRSTEQRARWIRSQMERLGSSYVRID